MKTINSCLCLCYFYAFSLAQNCISEHYKVLFAPNQHGFILEIGGAFHLSQSDDNLGKSDNIGGREEHPLKSRAKCF